MAQQTAIFKVRKAFKDFQDGTTTFQEWLDFREAYEDLGIIQQVINNYLSAQNRLREYKDSYPFKTRIRQYCNYHGYSDINPWEVVKVVSKKTVVIRKMDTIQTKKPSDFYAGGFSGHFADNHAQEYTYHSNENNPTKTIRLGRKGWNQGLHRMNDTPIKFYDYNF